MDILLAQSLEEKSLEEYSQRIFEKKHLDKHMDLVRKRKDLCFMYEHPQGDYSMERH
jgi:hypothetical protein